MLFDAEKKLTIFTSTGYEEHESDPAINADPNGTGSPTLLYIRLIKNITINIVFLNPICNFATKNSCSQKRCHCHFKKKDCNNNKKQFCTKMVVH